MSMGPTRRGRPVLAPYSPPASRSFSASSPNHSQVKGPSPTQEEYAFTTPMILSSLAVGRPEPTGAYAAMGLEEVV